MNNQELRSKEIFKLSLAIGIAVTCFLYGMVVLAGDSGYKDYSFEDIRMLVQESVLGPGIIMAALLFYFGYKKFRCLYLCSIIGIFPVLLEISVFYYFKFGIFPVEYLPDGDYRFFRGTEAYDLVCDIQADNILEAENRDIINFQETRSGMTPLLFCIQNGYYEKSEELLSMGADPNEINSKTSVSPLWMLSELITLSTIDLTSKKRLFASLLEKGANPDFVYQDKNVLMLLCSQAKPDSALINNLLQYGADVNVKFIQRDNYYHECYRENESALNMSIYLMNYSIALYLIDNGADTIGYRDWMLDVINEHHNDVGESEISYEKKLKSFLKK